VSNVTATAEHYRNVPILSGRHLGLFFDLSELALDLLLFDGLATRVQKISLNPHLVVRFFLKQLLVCACDVASATNDGNTANGANLQPRRISPAFSNTPHALKSPLKG
jgi:hypothetical protein